MRMRELHKTRQLFPSFRVYFNVFKSTIFQNIFLSEFDTTKGGDATVITVNTRTRAANTRVGVFLGCSTHEARQLRTALLACGAIRGLRQELET